MTGATCGARNAYPSGASGFLRGSCCPVICVSLFYVIVLSFGLCVLIVPFVCLVSIIFFTSVMRYLFARKPWMMLQISTYITQLLISNYRLILTSGLLHFMMHKYLLLFDQI